MIFVDVLSGSHIYRVPYSSRFFSPRDMDSRAEIVKNCHRDLRAAVKRECDRDPTDARVLQNFLFRR